MSEPIEPDAINRKCEDVFKSRAIASELERKRMRHFRRSLNDALNLARFHGLVEFIDRRKRRRAQPEMRMPRGSMSYVKELQRLVAPLFRCHDSCDSTGVHEQRSETDEELGNIDWNWGTEFVHLERALVHLMFASKKYSQVTDAINRMRLELLPKQLYGEIQDLWDHSNYHMVDLRRPVSEFTPVITFRIRQKFPCPTWRLSGRPKYNIPENAHLTLDEYFNKVTKKPARRDKQELARNTGLNYSTVTNWFKNRRQRRALNEGPRLKVAVDKVGNISKQNNDRDTLVAAAKTPVAAKKRTPRVRKATGSTKQEMKEDRRNSEILRAVNSRSAPSAHSNAPMTSDIGGAYQNDYLPLVLEQQQQQPYSEYTYATSQTAYFQDASGLQYDDYDYLPPWQMVAEAAPPAEYEQQQQQQQQQTYMSVGDPLAGCLCASCV